MVETDMDRWVLTGLQSVSYTLWLVSDNVLASHVAPQKAEMTFFSFQAEQQLLLRSIVLACDMLLMNQLFRR